jgi:hypothetical protein
VRLIIHLVGRPLVGVGRRLRYIVLNRWAGVLWYGNAEVTILWSLASREGLRVLKRLVIDIVGWSLVGVGTPVLLLWWRARMVVSTGVFWGLFRNALLRLIGSVGL